MLTKDEPEQHMRRAERASRLLMLRLERSTVLIVFFMAKDEVISHLLAIFRVVFELLLAEVKLDSKETSERESVEGPTKLI